MERTLIVCLTAIEAEDVKGRCLQLRPIRVNDELLAQRACSGAIRAGLVVGLYRRPSFVSRFHISS